MMRLSFCFIHVDLSKEKSWKNHTKKGLCEQNNLYPRSTVSLPQQLLMSYLLSSYLWVFEIRLLILTHLVDQAICSSLESQHRVVICCYTVFVKILETTKKQRDF